MKIIITGDSHTGKSRLISALVKMPEMTSSVYEPTHGCNIIEHTNNGNKYWDCGDKFGGLA